MTIKWDDRFSVNHSGIDAEHKLLLTTINAIEVALHLPDPRESLVFFIDELHGFATTHFQNEELISSH